MDASQNLTMSRRTFLAGAAALPFASLPVLAAPGLIDRVMVQGRPQDSGSLYKLRNIMPALDALGGIRKMRCRSPFSKTAGWKTYAGLAKQGVRFCFTLPVKDPAVLIADLADFERQFPGSTWAIEFPNEPDLNPVTYKGVKDKRLGARTGDAPALMAYCRDIAAMLSATPELKDIPRVAFNDWMQAEQANLATFCNSHIYPKPNSDPKAWLSGWRQRLAAGGYQQGLITEWGRTTGGSQKNNVAPPVSLDQQAELLSADLANVLSEPTVRAINLYELLSWRGAGEQENFGLFNADLTPRPVVAAIRSLLS